MKLNIVVEKDDEGRYVAECPDLPGCLSEGESIEDALENINEAIVGCLKSWLKKSFWIASLILIVFQPCFKYRLR